MRLLRYIPLLFALWTLQPLDLYGKSPAANANVRVPDAEIAAEIKERLARSKISKNGFQFRVANGVVTWTGKAEVIQHKGAATRMAKAAGARAVVNNIQISEAARAKARARLLGREGEEKPQRAAVVR